ncbi:MAG TPA: rhodanese-like domain-containing protein [Vicinamibacteria bacterium]|nr:rhodanese-like domain-containing protein [Vicinamibacteria bacterium]
MTNARRFLACLALLLVAAASVRAQQAVPAPADEVPRIEGPEVKRLVDKGEAVLLDVRNKVGWDAGHAEGAIHIPEAQLAARLQELPKDKLIAAYCT